MLGFSDWPRSGQAAAHRRSASTLGIKEQNIAELYRRARDIIQHNIL